MPVTHIHSESAFRALFTTKSSGGGDRCFLVDYSAKWCGPCRGIAPVYEQLSNKYGNPNFQFIHVDVDECGDVSQEAGVRALPTFVFYKNNTSTEITRIQGADPSALESKIKEIGSKFKGSSFGGEGNVLGGGSGVPSNTSLNANSSSLSPEEIQSIAQSNVNYDSVGSCKVGLRFLPNLSGVGKPTLRINGSEKVSKMRDYINSLLELSGVGNKSYELHNSYPPGKLDEDKSIDDCGVAGAVVVVKFL